MNDTNASIFFWFLAILAGGAPLWAWGILKILHKPTVKTLFITRLQGLNSYFVIIVTVIVIPCLLLMFIGSHITALFPQSPWAYVIQYDTVREYVVIDPQPHDCEFFKAPIGNKYCHFEKIVTVQKRDEALHQKARVFVGWNKVPE